ncbi:MAG: hypothetical protein WCF22_12965 [Candidatus Sulfotelmatobacter sp.]
MKQGLKLPRLQPLKRFDYKLVQERFDGLLINVDRDLQRRTDQAERLRNRTSARCLTLLDVMVRFAINAYHAVLYVLAETPEDPARRMGYSLVIAPVNRQLLDLLFSLVYMLDDFPARSLRYQRAGWREAVEEYHKFKSEYSNAREWRPYFTNAKRGVDFYGQLFGVTAKEKRKPSLIPYWKHPFELKDEKTPSRPFLRWLDKWLYGDTSAQAHLSFGGLLPIAPFLVAELVGGQSQEVVENYMIHQYRFHQFSRTGLVVLAIATEINQYCHLGNDGQVAYLWKMFVEHVPEGKDMFKARYERMTTGTV